MNTISKRNAAISNLNEKLNTQIPFEEEGAAHPRINPEQLLFRVEALSQKTTLPLTVKHDTLGTVETAVRRLEQDVANGFSINYFLTEEELELEVLDLSGSQILTVRSGMLWDNENISVTVAGDYETNTYKEEEYVGLIELDDTLEIVERGVKVAEFENSKIATLLNLKETLEDIRLIVDNERKYPLETTVSADDYVIHDLSEIGSYGIQELSSLNLSALANELNPPAKAKERTAEFSM